MTDYQSDIETHGRQLKSYNEVRRLDAQLRIKVLRETLFCLQSPYLRREYRRLADENLMFWNDQYKNKLDFKKIPKKIKVTSEDWGDAALRLTKALGVRFAVLNMANAYYPGGGYVEGMVAQEENMFRRTDCHFSLPRSDQYDSATTNLLKGANDLVYLDIDNPRVCIRGREHKDTIDYPFLDNSDIFSFYELRAAAVDYRGPQKNPFKADEAKKRIKAILNTLKSKGVRHVVLSAFGCGAFEGDATITARIFRDLLFQNYDDFDCVCFAIYNAGYGGDNFTSFNTIFTEKQIYFPIEQRLSQRLGLPNIGNSCYMNSVMQCLASTVPLIEYFSTSQYMLDLNCGSTLTTRKIASFLQNMVYAIQTPSNPETCTQLKLSFGNEFHNINQQDANELIDDILNRIHKETFYGEAKKFIKTKNNLSCEQFIDHEKQNDWSIINDIFRFYIETKSTCTQCKNSWTLEIDSNVILRMKKEVFETPFSQAVNSLGQNNDDDVTLGTCERCGEIVPVQPQFSFCNQHYPRILIIQLGRFSTDWDAVNGYTSKKNTTKVIFDDSLEFQKKTYNLYAIVNHSGSLQGGHYWAYCKSHNTQTWYKYNDDTVTQLEDGNYCTKEAYILFYQRA